MDAGSASPVRCSQVLHLHELFAPGRRLQDISGHGGDAMSTGLAQRVFPFLGWPRVDRSTAISDIVAGLTVALLVVPQSLAYAQLAGVPAYYGLYAAFIPSIVGVLFGSSALLSTGPVAMTSLLTAASVSQLTPPGTAQFLAYVTLLALLSGLMQIGMGLARAGLLLNLLSHPVLVGFINAAAVVIALSQLPSLTGISVPASGSVLKDTLHLLASVDGVHGFSLALGALGIAILYAFKRFAPKLPGVLVMVGILTAISYVGGFADKGGAIVGEVPKGLPSLSMPAFDWNSGMALLPAAFVIALVSFMEAMSSCKVIAFKTRSRWDENQELIGQGLAKVAAAFCQSMPVSGSFSRSALNLSAHGKTGYASLFTAAFVLLTLLLFTSLLYHLPKPALAAMIILAVANLIDVPAMRNAWRASRDDGIAAMLTFTATLALAPNIQNGILIGIGFSLAAFIYRRMAPRMALLALQDDGEPVAAGALPDELPENREIAALRFDAALFFANASFFEDAILKLECDNPKLRYIVVAASGIHRVDASAVEMLRGLVTHLRGREIELAFSGAQEQFLDVARRTGLAAEIGEANFFDSDELAIKALRARLHAPLFTTTTTETTHETSLQTA
jgi:sulfate permease, SulP family